jgi:predicted GH43/DUF377 family glycosyl hydrolase
MRTYHFPLYLSVLVGSVIAIGIGVFFPASVYAAAGTAWTKHPSNPVLSGDVATWDEQGVYDPAVILDGSSYKMWYRGGSGPGALGYAASTDGVTWTKSGSNPVLVTGAPGAWDASDVKSPTVVKDGATYKMWYTGTAEAGTMAIGYATSTDGVTWTKSGSNPVLSVGGSGAWDEYEVGRPTVIKDGSAYKMWYTGASNTWVYTIGYATSTDGITWTKSGSNPVLSVGGSGAWDEYTIDDPTVTFNGCNYEMWYTGTGSGHDSIGYATSTDGVTWAKSGSNPVLTPGLEGVDWDELRVDQPSVLQNGTTYSMWYEGAKFMGDPIGLATASEASSCSSDTPAPTPTPTPSSSASSGSVSAAPCPDPVPAGAPQLLVAQPNYHGEVTLRWEKAPDPVTQYAIVYGFSPGNYSFGVVNAGNVQTFTVGSLDPHITYYFAIRGVNGCAPGPLSNVLGANANPSTPVSGESWVTMSLGIAGLLLMGIGVHTLSNQQKH